MYNADELKAIVKRSAGLLKIEIAEEGAEEIARRSRGTPRIANRLLRRVRDYADERADGVITGNVADKALKVYEVDGCGLDNVDRVYMDTVITKFSGGPVGLDTLSAAIGEESGTIEAVIEPFLLQLGFIQRTPRGRIATPNAYKYFDLPMPGKDDESGQIGMF